MDQKLEDIKFGLLSDYELYYLIGRAEREREIRKQNPSEYFDVIYCNDGSEGFYVKEDDFHKIDGEELKDYIGQSLACGSGISFSVLKLEKQEYLTSCARYEWQFDDGSNTEPLDDDIDDDESDINDFKNK
jgi:hypothetical protein